MGKLAVKDRDLDSVECHPRLSLLKWADEDLDLSKQEKIRVILIGEAPSSQILDDLRTIEKGLDLDVFASLEELGFVGLLARYDVAIVDNDLADVTGLDVAAYMATFFGDKPVLLIGDRNLKQEQLASLSCVKGFMAKSQGHRHILMAAVNLAHGSRAKL
jgi:hypothetical protein